MYFSVFTDTYSIVIIDLHTIAKMHGMKKKQDFLFSQCLDLWTQLEEHLLVSDTFRTF